MLVQRPLRGVVAVLLLIVPLTHLFCVSAGRAQSVAAQSAASPTVDELSSRLKSIDPYVPTQQVSGQVMVFGSTSMDSMAHGWTSGFKQFHDGIQVQISAAGSGDAFTQLVQHPTGVAMVSRPVTQDELQALRQQGLKDPVAFVVAREALGVFVHSSNPVQTISGDQLRAIFTEAEPAGQLTWDLMGATESLKGKPIHVISRVNESGTQTYLRDFVFRAAAMREGITSHISNAEVLQSVSADPLSIAICGLRSSGKSVKSLKLTTGTDIVPSDDHAILSGEYPLTRPFTLVVDVAQTGAEAKASQEFVRYALCLQGQTEAIFKGFFPVDLPLLRAGIQRLSPAKLR